MPTHADGDVNSIFDWDLLVWSRLNAILCGPRAILDATFSSLRVHLELPLHEWSFTSGSPLPAMTTGTLIATDVVDATLEQQRAFLSWLDAHHAVRIITLSETNLYDLVQTGAMIDTLYYRLNPIYCALDPDCRSGSVDRNSAA
jgi:hypothetical protein